MAIPAQAYVCQTCDTCDATLGQRAYGVEGNPERFCDLTCCKIFYSRPMSVISKHRKERLQ